MQYLTQKKIAFSKTSDFEGDMIKQVINFFNSEGAGPTESDDSLHLNYP